MNIEGKIEKDGKFWLVEIPLLGGLITQGRTKKEAYEMANEWINNEIDNPEVTVDLIVDEKDNSFQVHCSSSKHIAGLILKTLRQEAGITQQEMADRLGFKSKNAYIQYEQGKALPSIDKLDEFLHALDPDRNLVLKFA